MSNKRQTAVALMKRYADRPMAVVAALIAKKCDLTILEARAYYRWIVAREMAPGRVEDARARGVPTSLSVQKFTASRRRRDEGCLVAAG
jgi:hypothetical protein